MEITWQKNGDHSIQTIKNWQSTLSIDLEPSVL